VFVDDVLEEGLGVFVVLSQGLEGLSDQDSSGLVLEVNALVVGDLLCDFLEDLEEFLGPTYSTDGPLDGVTCSRHCQGCHLQHSYHDS
jgi:hypothetical protein